MTSSWAFMAGALHAPHGSWWERLLCNPCFLKQKGWCWGLLGAMKQGEQNKVALHLAACKMPAHIPKAVHSAPAVPFRPGSPLLYKCPLEGVRKMARGFGVEGERKKGNT